MRYGPRYVLMAKPLMRRQRNDRGHRCPALHFLRHLREHLPDQRVRQDRWNSRHRAAGRLPDVFPLRTLLSRGCAVRLTVRGGPAACRSRGAEAKGAARELSPSRRLDRGNKTSSRHRPQLSAVRSLISGLLAPRAAASKKLEFCNECASIPGGLTAA